MEKQKKKLGLLPKLVIAIVLGLIVGFAAQKMGDIGEIIIRIGATYNSIFGNFLNFVIPLIIIGFVAPGIADLGAAPARPWHRPPVSPTCPPSSPVLWRLPWIWPCSPCWSTPTCSWRMPKNAEETVVSSLFTVEMPPIMGVMSALLIAFILGLGMAVIKNDTLKLAMNDFSEIVSKLVASVVIPLLPLHVYGIFAKLTYAGTIVELMTSFVKVFAVIIVLHVVILLFQYTIAGSAAKKNPFGLIKNMLPAYTTAIGTQSSRGHHPRHRGVTKKNGVSDAIAEFVCPLCATIHLSGSTITLTSCSIAVMMMMGQSITFGKMFPFILMPWEWQ